MLGQIATGGDASHLEEQLACVAVPERQLAILNGCYHNRVPTITVVVDAGWSKRSHKHSYNAKSGVGVIFGA